MKRDFKNIFRYFFYGITLALLIWTATLDYRLIARLIPNQRWLPAFGLVLFDGGLVGWLFTYIYRARGTAQRWLAFGMTILSLVGIGLFTAVSLILEAEQIITFVDTANLPNITVIAIGIQTFLFVASVVGYELTDPDIMETVALQAIEDDILSEAMEQFEKKAPQVAKRLTAEMSETMLKSLTARMALRIGEDDEYEYEVVKHKKGYTQRKKRQRRRRRAQKKTPTTTTPAKPASESTEDKSGGTGW